MNDNDYFEEVRKLSHNDDLRYKLLMRGVRKLLEHKKEKSSRFWLEYMIKRHDKKIICKWD